MHCSFFTYYIKGPCDDKLSKWYFDADSGECTAFSYSGCEGNANRFESQEQCDRQCGDFKGQASYSSQSIGSKRL